MPQGWRKAEAGNKCHDVAGIRGTWRMMVSFGWLIVAFVAGTLAGVFVAGLLASAARASACERCAAVLRASGSAGLHGREG
jgi:hypothetical protein